jgi:hypothetical protein
LLLCAGISLLHEHFSLLWLLEPSRAGHLNITDSLGMLPSHIFLVASACSLLWLWSLGSHLARYPGLLLWLLLDATDRTLPSLLLLMKPSLKLTGLLAGR